MSIIESIEHVCEWEITPQTGNFLKVVKCKICGGVLGASFVEAMLDEYEALKKENLAVYKKIDELDARL